MTIKKYIKETRNALGLTQARFGEELGVKRVTVTNYELGNCEPGLSVFIKIMKIRSNLGMKALP